MALLFHLDFSKSVDRGNILYTDSVNSSIGQDKGSRMALSSLTSDLRPQSSAIRSQALPQQLPGPAQPAWPGDDPQQAVSPGPGMPAEDAPDRDEWADMSFLRLPLPQRAQ